MCPICSAPGSRLVPFINRVRDFLLETTQREFDIMRCRDCGGLSLEPLPSEVELSAFYPDGYWRTEDGGIGAALERLYRKAVLLDHVFFVAKALRSSGRPVRLLDVGCGDGLFMSLCSRFGIEAEGVDFSATATTAAARNCPSARVWCGKFPEAVGGGPYRAITMFHFLEHTAKPLEALEGARRLLEPDGLLFVQVPNTASLQAKLFGARWYGLDPPRHLVGFSPRSLALLLEKGGFAPVLTRHFSLRDNAAAFASSLLPRLDPLARKVRALRRGWGQARLDLFLEVLYFFSVLCAQPLALAESLLGRGATITMLARRNR